MNSRILFFCAFSFLAVSTAAYATTLVEERDGIKITLYAPDWIWQGQNINVLVVAEHDRNYRIRLGTHLFLPEGLEDHFAYDGETSQYVFVEPGERKRIAFVNIKALTGYPRQFYEFEFVFDHSVADGGLLVRIPFHVRTIRGPMVSEGKWAAILPAALAAAWCLVIAMYLKRHAIPGAWKTPGESVFGGDPPKTS